MKINIGDNLKTYLMDIKILLAFLFVICLVIWCFWAREEHLFTLTRDFAIAIISLAVSNKMKSSNGNGKSNLVPPPQPPVPQTWWEWDQEQKKRGSK